jgi:hypothetical protein
VSVLRTAANIPALANISGDVVAIMFLYSLLLLMTLPDVIAAVAVPWVPAVVMVSAVAGVHDAAVDFTAVDVPGVSAIAAVPTAVSVPSAGVVFPTFLASLLLLASLLFLS